MEDLYVMLGVEWRMPKDNWLLLPRKHVNSLKRW